MSLGDSSTELGKVRGLGSAHEGGDHWISERVTSLALLVLGVWLIASLLFLPTLDYATVWLRVGKTLVMQAVFSPWFAAPMVVRRPAPPAPTTTTS